MSKFIYSTLSCDQKYTLYEIMIEGALPVPKSSVYVAGKANIANKHFLTPKGMVTPVKDEEYELLKENEVFKRHVDRGYIKVEEKEFDVDKAVSDMTGRDESAPLTPEELELEGIKATTGDPEEEEEAPAPVKKRGRPSKAK